MTTALQLDGESAIKLLAEHYRRTGELIEKGLKAAPTTISAGKAAKRRAAK